MLSLLALVLDLLAVVGAGLGALFAAGEGEAHDGALDHRRLRRRSRRDGTCSWRRGGNTPSMDSRPALASSQAFGELTSAASGSGGERQSRRECRLGDRAGAMRQADPNVCRASDLRIRVFNRRCALRLRYDFAVRARAFGAPATPPVPPPDLLEDRQPPNPSVRGFRALVGAARDPGASDRDAEEKSACPWSDRR